MLVRSLKKNQIVATDQRIGGLRVRQNRIRNFGSDCYFCCYQDKDRNLICFKEAAMNSTQ